MHPAHDRHSAGHRSERRCGCHCWEMRRRERPRRADGCSLVVAEVNCCIAGRSWVARSEGPVPAELREPQTCRPMGRMTCCRRMIAAEPTPSARQGIARQRTAGQRTAFAAPGPPCEARRTTFRPGPRTIWKPIARLTSGSHRCCSEESFARPGQRLAHRPWPAPRRVRQPRARAEPSSSVLSRKLTTWECSSNGERGNQGGGRSAATLDHSRPWLEGMQAPEMGGGAGSLLPFSCPAAAGHAGRLVTIPRVCRASGGEVRGLHQ